MVGIEGREEHGAGLYRGGLMSVYMGLLLMAGIMIRICKSGRWIRSSWG